MHLPLSDPYPNPPIPPSLAPTSAGLLVSHPGHLSMNTEPQPAGSKNDFPSTRAANSLARLKAEMPGFWGGGGFLASNRQRLKFQGPLLMQFLGRTPEAGPRGPWHFDSLGPHCSGGPHPHAPCYPAPLRRCLRSRGCPPGLERSLCPDLVIMSHSPGNRGPRSIWLRLRTFVSRCATIYRRKTGRIVIS